MSPGKSFELTIVGEELENIGKDLSETVIDSILDEGVLKEIPIISSVVSGFKIYSTIRERFYIKKLYKFLYELHDVSREERQKFVEKISKDQDKTIFFEKVLFLIDRQDDLNKSTIVGKLFAHTLKESISTEDFLRSTSSIDRIYFKDLHYLKDKGWQNQPSNYGKNNNNSYNEMINNNLEFSGFLIANRSETKAPPPLGISLKHVEYSLSNIGGIILKYGFE